MPHVQTNGAYWTCAYTQKVINFCRMHYGHDRKVFLYSGEENIAPCDEHIVCVTKKQQKSWFGEHDEGDIDRGGFNFNAAEAWWTEMNARAIGEIRKRCEQTDLLCITQGQSQQLIADAIPFLTVAEIGVGYEGIILSRKGGPCFAAYESLAFMHFVYGLNGWRCPNRWYDTVIPNYFDPQDFPLVNQGGGEYLLFMGRLVQQKGVDWAAKVAAALEMPLIVAGSGATAHGDGWVEVVDPPRRVECPGLKYVGPVGWEERAELMSGAAVLLAPTMYLEPFGGVAVEAMLAGTPAVTTDWGAFTETVQEDVSGYRFRTLWGAVQATQKAMELSNQGIRDYAIARYSLDAVRPLYDEWFARLDGLWGHGLLDLPEKQTA